MNIRQQLIDRAEDFEDTTGLIIREVIADPVTFKALAIEQDALLDGDGAIVEIADKLGSLVIITEGPNNIKVVRRETTD